MFHPRNAVDTPPLTFAAAYGCMTRVGITPPKVTVTADDKRLKAGKPAPDPFLLAAQELGCDTARVSSSTTRRPASVLGSLLGRRSSPCARATSGRRSRTAARTSSWTRSSRCASLVV
ncbi:hypothetical protein BD310DRAFT_926815, partial [Dichomitus squalens]